MSYSHYSLEDFLADPDFIRWVKSPDDENTAFWNAYLSKHIDQTELIHQARKIVLLFEINEKKITPGQYLEMWENISQATSADAVKLQPVSNPIKMKSGYPWYLKVAATLMLFAACIWIYAQYQKTIPLTISTGYGESRTLFLPDSTKVTLNANSSLRYVEKDFHAKNRNVMLEGQAFFTVTHMQDNRNFRVQTSELNVEVLGTRFDVNSRRGKTKVVLEEGKVRVDVPRNNTASNTLVMKPGDLAEVTGKSKSIDVKNVDPETYLAWRNNRLEFSGTPLAEIAQVLEDNYGYTVIFADPSLQNRNFSGSSPSDDVGELLSTLSRIFNIRVTQKGKEIVFDKQ